MQRDEDGGWVQYPGAKIDVSATVKAYAALKLMGDDPDAPHMANARRVILDRGGAESCNSFTTSSWPASGRCAWNALPEIPPEIICLPKWFYFHLDKVAAWTRTMIMPLAIVSALRPTRALPPSRGIGELFVDNRLRNRLLPNGDAHRTWSTVFCSMDRVLKLVDRATHS